MRNALEHVQPIAVLGQCCVSMQGKVYLYDCKMAPFEPGFPPEATALKNTAELKMVQEKMGFCNHTTLCIITERFVSLAARHSSL